MVTKFDPRLIPALPDLSFESALWRSGICHVAGIDEAGRGALAGPVTAAAIILPSDQPLTRILTGVKDSKQMTPIEREFWAERLRSVAIAWGVGFASPEEIDAGGIVAATRLAMARAIEQLSVIPQHLLLDFLDLPGCALPQTALVKGDARCMSIAAASILAKTARDEFLCQLDGQFPGYGFAAHKGYGTVAHRLAIERMGLSPVHRRSFKTSLVSRR